MSEHSTPRAQPYGSLRPVVGNINAHKRRADRLRPRTMGRALRNLRRRVHVEQALTRVAFCTWAEHQAYQAASGREFYP